MPEAIANALGTFLYPLFSIIFVAIDGIQQIFYGFAGIGEIYINGVKIGSNNTGQIINGSYSDSGIVYYLLTSTFIRNLFISLLALSLILLVLFGAIAFIRNLYNDKPKTWQEIVGNALKGLVGFVLTPVLCLFGAWGGNILLKAINSATSSSQSANLAGELFVVSAYNANYYRNGKASGPALAEEITGRTLSAELSNEDYADIVDNFYASNTRYYTELLNVQKAYEPFDVNYLLLGIGGVFMMYALGSISFGAIKRLFLLMFYFIISPLAHAIAPIDDGEAGKSVRKEFYKQFIGVYGAVVGLNLFFSIIPVFQNMQFAINGSQDFLFAGLINLIIIIVGLMTVKDLISFVGGFAGGGSNLYETGGTVKGGVKDKMKYGKSAVKIGGAFVDSGVRTVSAARSAYRDAIESNSTVDGFKVLSRKERNNLSDDDRKAYDANLKAAKKGSNALVEGALAGEKSLFAKDALHGIEKIADYGLKGLGLDTSIDEIKGIKKHFSGVAQEGRDRPKAIGKEKAYKDKIEGLKVGKDVFGGKQEALTEDNYLKTQSGSDSWSEQEKTESYNEYKSRIRAANDYERLGNLNTFLSKDVPKYNKDDDVKNTQKTVFNARETKNIMKDVLHLTDADLKGMKEDAKAEAVNAGYTIMGIQQNIDSKAETKDVDAMKRLVDQLTKYIDDRIAGNFDNTGLLDWANKIQVEAKNKLDSLTVNTATVSTEKPNTEQTVKAEFTGDAINAKLAPDSSVNANVSQDSASKIGQSVASSMNESEHALLNELRNIKKEITELPDKLEKKVNKGNKKGNSGNGGSK